MSELEIYYLRLYDRCIPLTQRETCRRARELSEDIKAWHAFMAMPEADAPLEHPHFGYCFAPPENGGT